MQTQVTHLKTTVESRLLRLKERILSDWERRVVDEIESAEDQSKIVLRDMLPTFITKLASSLDREDYPESSVEKISDSSREHGIQRATLTEYSIAEVLREYHLLRKVIVGTLTAEGGLSPQDRDVIDDCLDEAMILAGSEFTEQREVSEKNHLLELERFASITAHDLKEPLSSISLYAQLAGRTADKHPDPELKDWLKSITDATKRMSSLIDSLLSLAVAGGVGQAGEVDCNSVLISVKENLEQRIKEVGAEIRFQNLPKISGNKVQIPQLFQNLIANALKFSAHSNIPKIDIEAEDKGAEWLFSVKDNGIGIEKKFLKLIFEEFRSLHSKSEYGGSGLGLAICTKIVQSHRGKIWAESEPGKGSTFKFTIPKQSVRSFAQPD